MKYGVMTDRHQRMAGLNKIFVVFLTQTITPVYLIKNTKFVHL